MFERDDKIIVKEILDSFDKISEITEHIDYSNFKNDSEKIISVLKEIDSIGKNCRAITGEFRLSNEEVNWNYIIRTRRRLSHSLLNAVNTDVIWTLVKKDYPLIRENICKLLNS
ncbi:MAG: DUF86 domain-containing protein [Bacteroidetes bacterium]|nr:DUF86 domain-containing protein [Bacteroidota bacterium]MBX7044456.1 DUF86 domain-containing protein [Ignavibacteria bacterium]